MSQAVFAAAKAAAPALARAGRGVKDSALFRIADALVAGTERIISANEKDVAAAREKGVRETMIDRLRLTPERIASIAAGVREVAALPDPVGVVDKGFVRGDGLSIQRKRVPLGVVGIIYEARPNVTADAAALCLKSGNACVLRGGREALASNVAIAEIMRSAVEEVGLPADCICLLADTTRAGAEAMMHARGFIDVLIPRGGAGLIRSVAESSTVPVIETGVGNCHIYVEKTASAEMAKSIIINAKTSRPSVCNAAESLIFDREALRMLPEIADALIEKGVELRADPESLAVLGNRAIAAGEEDFATEFLGLTISVKTVSGIDEAIGHIAKYGTGHSEAIVTSDYAASEKFLNEVDAAAVYVNASTRFTDGNEFGLGAEIGISTQKLHARGPMGLEALTSMKYTVRGNGQIR
ncbi:MAG: glutamate-5-semialdehyde dehydrogenase [Ruminococcaceae bacterium]|nr:glutamate-5-semialdehyde dehydrogenase [Oscillospiraceae bacterium]